MVTEISNTRMIRIRHGTHTGAESEVCTILSEKLVTSNEMFFYLRYHYDFLITIYLIVFLGFISPIQSSENGKG